LNQRVESHRAAQIFEVNGVIVIAGPDSVTLQVLPALIELIGVPFVIGKRDLLVSRNKLLEVGVYALSLPGAQRGKNQDYVRESEFL
jgi:hypothetical protein